MKIIGHGAEATIYRIKDKVIKERIPKGYRLEILDKQIIKRRTKAETKILKLASKIILAPIPEDIKEINKIIMPFIEGDNLSQKLDSYNLKLQKTIMYEIGQSVSKLHNEGIIHGDLTTSNMIYCKKPTTYNPQLIIKKDKVFFIDFGLGFLNGKYEDKGIDIHLLKQALEAKHFENWEILFKKFEIGYRSIEPEEAEKVFKRLSAIEKRGRYKH